MSVKYLTLVFDSQTLIDLIQVDGLCDQIW